MRDTPTANRDLPSDELREQIESYRQQAEEESVRQKDSVIVRKRLLELYERLNAGERIVANQLFSEWALSHDESVRFDALGLINDLRIHMALPALQELAIRLRRTQTPGAPFELEKVERIVLGLAQSKP